MSTTELRCSRCKQPRTGTERSIYCTACEERSEAEKLRAQWDQWNSISGARLLMNEWTLETFPADDPAGRAALEAVEPWLWANTYLRLVEGALVEIDDMNPDPDIDDEDHPIWPWYHGDSKPNLYLWGPVGSGKTGLAWSLLRIRVLHHYDYEDRHEWPTWANVVSLLADARAAMSAHEPSPIRRLYDASVLVLDDLGAERPTDWARDEIAALVQHRHTRDLPTIVTSNYAPSALARRLGHDDRIIGQRIVSRLTENCVKVKLDRADLRARRAA